MCMASVSQLSQMSQPSQSQRQGTCSVCFRPHMKLYDKGQYVYRHGPHSRPCSGTGKPPLEHGTGNSLPASLANQQTMVSGAVVTDPQAPIDTAIAPGLTTAPLPHPCSPEGTIKHIPKAARVSCSSVLADLLDKVSSNPEDAQAWMNLLQFGPNILAKPPRGGKRHNLANAIKKRCTNEAAPTIVTGPAKDKPRRDPDLGATQLASAVTSKIEEGNLKAAIRIISSDEKIADFSPENLAALRSKHPSAAPIGDQLPDPSNFSACQISTEAVRKAIGSFPAGSSGGPDGLRPAHLSELTRCKETGIRLLESVVNLVNTLLLGNCPTSIREILFGGKLLALNKPGGGLRPIAIGYYWRRLTAKCANTIALDQLGDFFAPIQLGVGVKGGCEAAIHAARRFCSTMSTEQILVKLDFRNAFNSINRETVLRAVAAHIPMLYAFCHLTYANHTSLLFGEDLISSEDGVQQGDPLGPLLFCLSIHPILAAFQSPFIACFMDDVTLGGDADTVERDVLEMVEIGARIGLVQGKHRFCARGCQSPYNEETRHPY